LVPGKTAITPMCFDIRWLHVGAIHLSLFVFPADDTARHFLCHGFAKLVQEDECRLPGMARSAGLDGQKYRRFDRGEPMPPQAVWQVVKSAGPA
jgi:hypothetical protein